MYGRDAYYRRCKRQLSTQCSAPRTLLMFERWVCICLLLLSLSPHLLFSSLRKEGRWESLVIKPSIRPHNHPSIHPTSALKLSTLFPCVWVWVSCSKEEIIGLISLLLFCCPRLSLSRSLCLNHLWAFALSWWACGGGGWCVWDEHWDDPRTNNHLTERERVCVSYSTRCAALWARKSKSRLSRLSAHSHASFGLATPIPSSPSFSKLLLLQEVEKWPDGHAKKTVPLIYNIKTSSSLTLLLHAFIQNSKNHSQRQYYPCVGNLASFSERFIWVVYLWWI